MPIMPRVTSTDTSQQRDSSSIRTGVCSARAVWTQVVRDDGKDGSTAGRQGGRDRGGKHERTSGTSVQNKRAIRTAL